MGFARSTVLLSSLYRMNSVCAVIAQVMVITLEVLSSIGIIYEAGAPDEAKAGATPSQCVSGAHHGSDGSTPIVPGEALVEQEDQGSPRSDADRHQEQLVR